jgi:hypothetical protein
MVGVRHWIPQSATKQSKTFRQIRVYKVLTPYVPFGTGPYLSTIILNRCPTSGTSVRRAAALSGLLRVRLIEHACERITRVRFGYVYCEA